MLANIFGNFTAGIIRLAFTAATILLIYLFILKPILQTTENVSKGFGSEGAVEKALDAVNQAFAGEGADSIRRQIESQIGGIGSDSSPTERKKANRLLRCVQNANGNVDRMQRCAKRFAP